MPMLTFNLSPKRGFVHRISATENQRILIYDSTLKGTLTVKGYGGEVTLKHGTVRIIEKLDTDNFGTIGYIPKTDCEDSACYQVDTFTSSSTFEYLLYINESDFTFQVSMNLCPDPHGSIQFGGWGCGDDEIEWLIADKLDTYQQEEATETTIYVDPNSEHPISTQHSRTSS